MSLYTVLLKMVLTAMLWGGAMVGTVMTQVWALTPLAVSVRVREKEEGSTVLPAPHRLPKSAEFQ